MCFVWKGKICMTNLICPRNRKYRTIFRALLREKEFSRGSDFRRLWRPKLVWSDVQSNWISNQFVLALSNQGFHKTLYLAKKNLLQLPLWYTLLIYYYRLYTLINCRIHSNRLIRLRAYTGSHASPQLQYMAQFKHLWWNLARWQTVLKKSLRFANITWLLGEDLRETFWLQEY